MTKKELKKIFMEAKDNKCDVCVEVTIPGQKDTEYIINKNKSIDNKLEYYDQAYDDNLIHVYNDAIRIVNAFALDFYMGDN
jgi:hypothetical protein